MWNNSADEKNNLADLVAKLKQEILDELKSELALLIESKFQELELQNRQPASNHKVGHRSTCNEIPYSVSSDYCVAKKKTWPAATLTIKDTRQVDDENDR